MAKELYPCQGCGAVYCWRSFTCCERCTHQMKSD